ncbi:MAG: 30S ribosome-binding factor RbfA [Proteobacteria bacterium]|nr:30S ribosome-binding factor RbfA [Pseudomonadota bacterium]
MANVNKDRKKEQIKIKLSTILRKSSGNPKFAGVTIVDVKLSPDSSTAVVFYSVFDSKTDPAEITKALNAAGGFFQSKLSKTMKSRSLPKLKFVFDGGFDHADRIDRLLTEIGRHS